MRKIALFLALALSLSTGAYAAGAVDASAVLPAYSGTAPVSGRLLPPRAEAEPPADAGKAPANNPEKTPAADVPAAAPTGEMTLQQQNADKIAALRKKLSGANFRSKVESGVIDAHNVLRKQLGLGTLVYDKDLQTAARQRSYELYKSDTFAHKRPDGRSWHTVLTEDVPYTFSKAGENLCTTEYDDPSLTLAFDPQFWTDNWINSPSHYETMIDPVYTRVGIGVYSVKKDGRTYAYATALFSRPTK